MKNFIFSTAFLFFLIETPAFAVKANQQPIKDLPKKSVKYDFIDKKISHIVLVVFISKNKISFEMKITNKINKKICILKGIAVSQNSSAEFDLDENGNGYPSKEYNYSSVKENIYINFRLQKMPASQTPVRMQISQNESVTQCNFETNYYIISLQ